MTNATLQLDRLTEQNLQVMQAYTVRATTAKASVEDFDGWLERINELPELSSDDLTQSHGQLIAMGFLKFEITGRSVGLRYQISPRGKQALDRALSADPAGENDAEDDQLTHQNEAA